MLFSDAQNLELHQAEGLMKFLERQPVKPALPSLDAYAALTRAKREQFNSL